MKERDQKELELAQVVLEYLMEHPLAMDTSEGIGEWWVMRQGARVDLRLLKKVLRDLTAHGLLESEGEGENTRYRLRSSVS